MCWVKEKNKKRADLTDEKDIKAFDRTYGFDIRSKTCDTIRVLFAGQHID